MRKAKVAGIKKVLGVEAPHFGMILYIDFIDEKCVKAHPLASWAIDKKVGKVIDRLNRMGFRYHWLI